MARTTANEAAQLEQRAAANRAAFDAQKANRQTHAAEKLNSGIYD